jgi:hypothetical protein
LGHGERECVKVVYYYRGIENAECRIENAENS